MHATHSELCSFYDVTGKPARVYQAMPGQAPERIANEKLEDSLEMSKYSHGFNPRLRTSSDGTNFLYGVIDFDKESVKKMLQRTENLYRDWFVRTFVPLELTSVAKDQAPSKEGAEAGAKAIPHHDPRPVRFISLKQAGRQYARLKYHDRAELDELEKENAVNR